MSGLFSNAPESPVSSVGTAEPTEEEMQGREAFPLVSVIVLNYQGKAFILRCLQSVLDSTYPNLEVIVVDNGSTDDSMDTARAFGERVLCIENGKNLGFAAGCNVGIRVCRGELIALLNVDTMVRPDWMEKLVEPFLRDERVGLTGSKLYFLDGKTIQHAGGEVLPNGLCQHRGYGVRDDGRFNQPQEVDYLTGASLVIRRSALESIGLLDEGYFFYYDDVDLASEMKARGYRVLYAPASTVLHFETFGLQKKSFAYYSRFHRGRMRYMLKHFGMRYFFGTFIRAEWDWYRYCDLRTQLPSLVYAYLRSMPKAPYLWLRGLWVRWRLKRAGAQG